GCQMNFSDSEIVGSIMADANYESTMNMKEADVIFINTCSIRDNAEQRVRARLREFKSLKKKNPELVIGLLGCMAERLKDKLLVEEPHVTVIAGPDAYRELPKLMTEVEEGQKAVNILLSSSETYEDIEPIRIDNNGVSAFISIMRGCENYCSYCVVPYTRGKERSRNPQTIIDEAADLFSKGYREVTLLGQNVNSYAWENGDERFNFTALIEKVALINPLLRVRFATSHPKDLSDELIEMIARYPNICKAIHLPVQSGSTRMLAKMNRKYDRNWYLGRIEAIKSRIPDCTISTDIIAGFCSETEEDHQDTLNLMKVVPFDMAYMFKYSERPDTAAAKRFPDDVPEEVKGRRLQEIIDLQQQLSLESNKKDIGKTFEVLVEGFSKRSNKFLFGRTSQNKVAVFEAHDFVPGDYVKITVTDCTPATLISKVAVSE
ncbi:MAG: tRNA (N6-isopentenyl adenosine(37)-C2)-methylthiotransferase MiaB, partial [Bacteroidota bacterium]|nr:tRNA (N6-isopentenyl adenosine(37)-C2)-methylthiotransferase MiaB [Bacteroidota bacterium]